MFLKLLWFLIILWIARRVFEAGRNLYHIASGRAEPQVPPPGPQPGARKGSTGFAGRFSQGGAPQPGGPSAHGSSSHYGGSTHDGTSAFGGSSAHGGTTTHVRSSRTAPDNVSTGRSQAPKLDIEDAKFEDLP